MTWVQTYSRVAFDLAAPRAEDIRLDDLAHSLAYQCRFGGHTRLHVSVAQHSVMVAAAMLHATGDRHAAAHALLHDAHECYLGDIKQPVKALLAAVAPGAVKAIERRIDAAIFTWAGLDPDRLAHEVAIVKLLDLRALFTERDRYMGPPTSPWVGEGEFQLFDRDDFEGGDLAWGVLSSPWRPEIAEPAFRYAFSVLLPDVPRGPSSDRWPPPWMAAGLRAALPLAIAEVAGG